ncbi:ATP-binding protein [Terrimonas sp. NA20]|uniref:histidine kinase n=1 Tax=Terrimonas ginsenosidimutans TaxID=2908004 RepID=A0ABS9KYS3_9BACT|nr:hybrid sensor histidine kinase/response regulator transcription factor [Terrimonas ginsenosidimutans]MCG2617502.1 ATP-binding protein [Terrimonas ginsenosidimutans]
MKSSIQRLLFLLLPITAWAQQPATDKPALARLSIAQGLSNNSVRCIFQDHRGFIWFGTYDGLNRYDGYNFKVFRNKLNDTASLPHNYIYAIHEDRNNNLWIGTGQGLTKYNSSDNTFSTAYLKRYPGRQMQKISANVNWMDSDPSGNLFIGTNGWGLLVKKTGETSATQVPFSINGKMETGYNVQSVAVDSQQRVWLFILEAGLCEYDPKRDTIRVVNNFVRTGQRIATDKLGHIWIGSNSGVYEFAQDGKTLLHHYNEQQGGLSSNRVAGMSFDTNQNLWIGTEGGGISILPADRSAMQYLLPGENRSDLSSESVFAIHADRENRVWIGTIKGGVNIVDWQKSRFQTYTHDPLSANSLINNFVSSFFEDTEKNIWIGTDGGGMSKWNRADGKFQHFKHIAGNAGSLSNNSISSITQDHEGQIWVATFGGGVSRYNKRSGKFDHYPCINTATGAENKNAWLVYEDQQHDIWATTFGVGKVYLFNRVQNRFEVFDQQLNDLIALKEDRDGNLWGGNSYQLVKIDKKGKQHQVYEFGKPIRSIFEDSHKRFWVGTEGGGLILFDKQQGKIKAKYSDAEGLCNNSVLNILEDGDGRLWLSTFNGLSRFDPSSGQFKNFYQSDGLQSNQFSYNAALRLSSGELLFGGIAGFNIFDPKNVLPRNYMPPVFFTDIRVNNKGLSDISEYISPAKDGSIQTLEVPYNQAVLSFTFTALEYTSSEKIRYSYFLEGWDKGWNYTGGIRTINYNNISEGSYKLRIKSTNAEGIWNNEETSLSVVVLPPWYRTIWAYLVYILGAGALVVVYFRYKNRQAKLRYEIRLANLNSEKEKEINEKRQTFFTNVSHEFRTPLTLIINPIRDILKKNDSSKEEHAELNIVYRNARRLLSLVDQLLLFRKAEDDADQLRVGKLNLHNLCNEVYLCFIQQAKAKHIHYLYECENRELEIYADREKMEIIFYNLLSNAVKYTQEGGTVVLRVIEHSDTIEAFVTDNGVGMPLESQKRLFEKFYQVKDKTTPVKPGFGIGLYLVKHTVESHKGTISFESAPGKGTSFRVTLLKGKQHFADMDINDAVMPDPVILPELAEEEPIVETESSAGKEAAGLGSMITDQPSLLVIDDNEQMRTYVSGIFKNQFIVHEASSAEDGLLLARKYLPDMIISDVVMGQMSGIELCKTIKQTPSLNHIPVILLTGSYSTDSKLKGVEGGADDYITKPFEKDLLQARVASLMKSRENLQKYFYNEITHQENSLKISAEYKEFLEQCIAIVEQNIDNEDFNIQQFATAIGMSHSKLYKKIKAVSGQTANAFIRYIRLRKAAELFINTNYNVNETAFYVGIKDVKYFREQFHKTFGVNPSEYIEKYRKVFGKNYSLSEKVAKEKGKGGAL